MRTLTSADPPSALRREIERLIDQFLVGTPLGPPLHTRAGEVKAVLEAVLAEQSDIQAHNRIKEKYHDTV